jgi:hypothetical protein
MNKKKFLCRDQRNNKGKKRNIEIWNMQGEGKPVIRRMGPTRRCEKQTGENRKLWAGKKHVELIQDSREAAAKVPK